MIGQSPNCIPKSTPYILRVFSSDCYPVAVPVAQYIFVRVGGRSLKIKVYVYWPFSLL